MVHRWRCRRCEFSVWSASRSETTSRVKKHLLTHYQGQLSKREFQVHWECPYCEQSADSHDQQDGVQRFQEHLFGHVEALMESGVHVAEEFDGAGSVLVTAPLNSTGADNARLHFCSPGDILVFVTTTPEKRIRLVEEQLQEWPAWTIVLTTKENPLAGIDDIDFSSVPLEVVRLDRRLGLRDLGETLSRVIDEQDTTTGKISVEFDILSEILAKFEMQRVFKFMHILTSRLEDAGAISHFYINPGTESASTVNILKQMFDLTITADERTFVTGNGSD